MVYEFSSALKSWKIFQQISIDACSISDTETEIWRDDGGLLSVSRTFDKLNRYCLRFSDQVVVDILADEKHIIDRTATTTAPTTRDHFLADQVLPRVLAHDGKFVLHAAGCLVGDRAIILMGTSGTGKSTLAASFNQSGGSLIGDDALIVSWEMDRPCVSAVYRSLRLLPDSVEALFLKAPHSTSVAPYTDKLRITLPVSLDHEPVPMPIAAIFVLGDPSPSAGIQIDRLRAGDACMACISNSFALDPTNTALASKKLQSASALARRVPAFNLRYPRDYARLPDVRAAILSQVESHLATGRED